MTPKPPTSRPPLDRRDAAFAVVGGALALATRLHFLLSAPDRVWPHSAWLEGDAPLWAHWAGNLAAGRDFERGLAIHSPAVAYMLRWLGCSDVTTDFTGAKVAWCAVSAIGCALAYLAFRLEAGRRTAAIGAALLVFSFSSYVTATSLNGEALYAALLPLIVIGTLRLNRAAGIHDAMGIAAALGLAHGLATLIRPEHTLLLAMLLACTLWARRRDLLRATPAQRTLAALALTIVISVAVCLPWAISTARATERFNTIPSPAPDYAHAPIPWTADARVFLDSLPAFARADNFAYLNYLAGQKGIATIDEATLRSYFDGLFHTTPDPLAVRHLVSGQGPLCFALANHPQATGGFAKAALATPFSPDPQLMFSYPPHALLYNHGYRVGWEAIRADPKRWGGLVLRKLGIFADGAAQGLTDRNVPLGREGVRRAVDQFIARSPVAPLWKAGLAAILVLGLAAAARGRIGGVWILVLLSKVIVTAAFYGYARQAASILPAFAFFLALGIDGVATFVASRLPRWRERAPTPWLAWLWAVPVLALLATDFVSVPAPEAPAASGVVRPAPRWGAGAWETVEDIALEPMPGR